MVGFIGFFISIALITIAAITSSSHEWVQVSYILANRFKKKRRLLQSKSAPTEMEDVKKGSIDVNLQQPPAPSEVETITSPPMVAESNGSTGSDGIYESLKSQQGSVSGSATLDSSTIIAQIMEPIYAIPMKKKTVSSSTLSGDFDIEVDNRRDSEINEIKMPSTKWFQREPDDPAGSDVDDSHYSRNIELPTEDVIVHASPN